ncbi:MAG: amino acid permease [Spirochaetaceae bacterium]|nr:MAG: amino acid permease [Spirochaetaceae bacterium]
MMSRFRKSGMGAAASRIAAFVRQRAPVGMAPAALSRRKGSNPEGPTVSVGFAEADGEAVIIRVRTLGTFGGVFTPSFLTIIGVIMYLRFGWVLANAGLVRTLLIVLIANAITFITSLSVAGIASNEQMDTGGAYFMVSRVMGYQAGGGIGIPLFLSQSLSIALYVIGFAEAFTAIVPDWSPVTVAISTMFVLALIGLVGARFMVMMQYVILAVILASFVSIAAGFQPLYLPQNLEPSYLEGLAFWGVFAVFFPAVTGILAGVSMSGDLKTPERSIPRGTFLAVGAGFLVYLLVPVMLAFTVPRDGLWVSTALRDASRWPAMVTAGVIGATLSSAIGSLMAAPRTLQALGIDGVVPRLFGRGVGKTQEPLIALAVSIGLAFAAILLGNLNQVAEVLTMFFLTTYGVLNLAAGMERLVDNPSFRPSVRVPWWVSFAGAIGSFAVMFLISAWATVVAVAVVGAIFAWLGVRPVRGDAATAAPSEYGGLWEGFWTTMFFRVARRLSRARTGSGKNWRPLVQVFAADVDAHGEMMSTAAMLTRRGGALATYAMIQRSSNPADQIHRGELQASLDTFVRELVQPNVYSHVVETNDFHEGVVVAAQSAGFAAGSYNTVMAGLPSLSRMDQEYARMLTDLSSIQRNVILMKKGPQPWMSIDGPIIVWWGGQENNVRLMLILAYLLAGATGKRTAIQLKTIVADHRAVNEAEERLRESLRSLRMQAETNVVVNADETPIPDVLARESAGAALVVLGMAKPDEATAKTYLASLRRTTSGLGAALLVMNNIPDIRYI